MIDLKNKKPIFHGRNIPSCNKRKLKHHGTGKKEIISRNIPLPCVFHLS
jgi:hypothetical protein